MYDLLKWLKRTNDKPDYKLITNNPNCDIIDVISGELFKWTDFWDDTPKSLAALQARNFNNMVKT